jgi:trafficking protein particle complex subunit 3
LLDSGWVNPRFFTNQQPRTRVDKVNAELVTLTYGTIVAQLCNDYDSDYMEVNRQLDRMGYNIGMRLIEDFFAKSNTGRCGNFKETAEVISKAGNPFESASEILGIDQAPRGCQVGFKIFLNITPTIANWTSDNKQFSLLFDENPLSDFVELPDDGRAQDELWFSNILCGVLRGALEMVGRVAVSSIRILPLHEHPISKLIYPGANAGRGAFCL